MDENQIVDENLSMIRKALADKKAIVGTKRALKALRSHTISTVYVTKNAPQEVRETVEHYTKLNNVQLVELTQSNEELGTACRKPFLISVLAVAK